MSDTAKIILVVVACGAGLTLVVFLLIGLFTVVKAALTHIARFIGAEVSDAFRLIGSIITALAYSILLLGNIVIGRWSGAAHFGRGVRDEVGSGAKAFYRVVIGNPARLLLMRGLVEGIEDRLPAMVQAAPGTDAPSKRSGQFEGYKILGSLPTGGSGSKLYIAQPDVLKRAGLERAGHTDLSQVVIKTFSLADGSSLPQIVRESRALDAAMKLGLILDHDLTSERFFYVMRYVPGQNLTLVTKQLHASSEGSSEGGLDEKHLKLALGFVADLLRTLDRYHQGGLWHKDVKPDNIIVEGEHAHLVDFGLVTPLRSAMTLTTHGTEYFRDPEMVRQALKGVKVHEIDGTRFDIFGAGAVLYAILEDAFPAHGVLSPVTKSCPEALKWVMRRAMTDYDKRYPSAGSMLADIEAVRLNAHPFSMRPVDLPSMRESGELAQPLEVGAPAAAVAANAVSVGDANSSGMAQPPSNGVGAAARNGAGAAPVGKPRIVVENWWTGKSRTEAGGPVGSGSASGAFKSAKEAASRFKGGVFGGFAAAGIPGPGGAARRSPLPKDGPRRPAAEQVQSARARAHLARARAQERLGKRIAPAQSYSNGVRGVVALVVLVFVGAITGLVVNATHRMSAGSDVPSPQALQGGDRGSPAPTNPQSEFPGFANMGGQVAFVISDLDALDTASAAEAKRGLGLLRDAGMKLAGMPVEAILGPADVQVSTADITEMAATLRLARGQAPLESASAVEGVRAWLLKHSEQFDLVVWLAKEPGGQGKDGLFHFIGFKDSSRPGTLGYTAKQMIDGIISPGKRAVESTIASGEDIQKMLEDLGARIANAKKSVENSLLQSKEGEGPPGLEPQRSMTAEARDYVLRLVNDAGRILSTVRSSMEQAAATEPKKEKSKPRRRSPGDSRHRAFGRRIRQSTRTIARRAAA